MNNFVDPALVIKEGIPSRLKEARNRLGLKQSELAEVGQVSRPTQMSYENDITAPNTKYLRLVQKAGIDIPYVLFGVDSTGSVSPDAAPNVNWKLVQEAFEAVEFHCFKYAPSCPGTYKWKLAQLVYADMAMAPVDGLAQNRPSAEVSVRRAWERLMAAGPEL